MEKVYKEGMLKEIIARVFEIDHTDVNEDTSPDTVEKWDSLHHMNLVVALEESFRIELSEDQTLEILNYQLIKIVLQEHGIMFK
jgi:acyl carrier protein